MQSYYNPFRIRVLLSVILLSLVWTVSCSRDDDDLAKNAENDQFYELMKEWYFWTDQMPSIDPSSYENIGQVLEALRYRNLDRWSFIEDWDVLMAFFENTEFIGYGFGSRYDSQGQLRISFIYNTVPMFELGVRRGWIIQAINDTPVNPGTNINSLLGPNQAGVKNTFRMTDPKGNLVEFELAKEVLQVNTVLHHEVIDQNNLTIGYLVLQTFTGSTADELEEIFAQFKEAGIEELILDMRYNGGGLTSAATLLSALIGGENVAGQPFARYAFNRFKQDRNSVVDFGNEANGLGLNRLVVIATGSSASASEMVINGLRPYMDVTIVGNNTYGKPMGSNILRFKNWGVAPITFNVTNANDEGDFFEGIPVDIPASDDLEYDFGDEREGSFQQALSFISFGVAKDQPVTKTLYEQPSESFRGLQRMTGSH